MDFITHSKCPWGLRVPGWCHVSRVFFFAVSPLETFLNVLHKWQVSFLCSWCLYLNLDKILSIEVACKDLLL